ncbi:MAG: hypothetical protein AAFU03_01815, partial [Bacteroidota bacterium]
GVALVESIGGQEKLPAQLGAVILMTTIFYSPCSAIVKKVLNPGKHVGLRKQLVYREAIRNPIFSPPYTVLTHYYQANVQFYVKEAQLVGRDITHQSIQRVIEPYTSNGHYRGYAKLPFDTRVMLCENQTWKWMANNYDFWVLEEASPCKLVQIREPKEGLDIRHRN